MKSFADCKRNSLRFGKHDDIENVAVADRGGGKLQVSEDNYTPKINRFAERMLESSRDLKQFGLYTFGDQRGEQQEHSGKDSNNYHRTTSLTTLASFSNAGFRDQDSESGDKFEIIPFAEQQQDSSFCKNYLDAQPRPPASNLAKQTNPFGQISISENRQPSTKSLSSSELKKLIMGKFNKNQQTLQQISKILDSHIANICNQFAAVIELASAIKNELIREIEHYKIEWHSNLKQAQEQYLKNAYKRLLTLDALCEEGEDNEWGQGKKPASSFDSRIAQELKKVEKKVEAFQIFKNDKIRELKERQNELKLINADSIIWRLSRRSDEPSKTKNSIANGRAYQDFNDLKGR